MDDARVMHGGYTGVILWPVLGEIYSYLEIPSQVRWKKQVIEVLFPLALLH